MRIDEVTLPTRDPPVVAAFYRDVLELATEGLTVHVGATILRLTAGPDSPGAQHLAFNVPADRFDAAAAWLKDQCEPMSRNGQDRFHFDPPFDADSIYFLDPDGTILELIARRAAPRALAVGPFTSAEILSISEVAAAVPSVPAAVASLASLGLRPLGGGTTPADALFAAVGDHDGMIILTSPERPWLPTLDRLPNLTPTRIVAAVSGEVVLGNGTRVGG